MEEAFEKLKKEGKNDVDSLVKWLKDSKVIDSAKSSEDKARALFADCADKKNVEYSKFKEAVGKLATEQKKNADDFSKSLVETGPKLLDALKAAASAGASAAMGAGASAFKQAFSKK